MDVLRRSQRICFVSHLPTGGVFVRVWADRLPADTAVSSSGNRLPRAGTLELGPNGGSVGDQRGHVPGIAGSISRGSYSS